MLYLRTESNSVYRGGTAKFLEEIINKTLWRIVILVLC